MKFLSRESAAEWRDLHLDPSQDEKSKATIESNRTLLIRFLSEVVLSARLTVLCGLGTSLVVRDAKQKQIAPTMKDLWDEARAKVGQEFDEILKRVKYTTPSYGDNIELLLSRCLISERFEGDGSVTKFVDTVEDLIANRCRFVDNNTDLKLHQDFIRRLAKRPVRQSRMQLFTTNYDQCFEAAATHSRFVVIDGFSHGMPQEFDGAYFEYDFVKRGLSTESPDFIPNVFQLYKLHGSVDWAANGATVTKEIKPKKPLMIYPRFNKFEASYDQPFIEMMSRFQLLLRQANVGLLIIGFGFNDDHVAQPIISAVRSNVNLKVLIVDPGIKAMKSKAAAEIRHLAEQGDPRICLLDAGFEEFVPLIPDLAMETEEDKHLDRIRGARGI